MRKPATDGKARPQPTLSKWLFVWGLPASTSERQIRTWVDGLIETPVSYAVERNAALKDGNPNKITYCMLNFKQQAAAAMVGPTCCGLPLLSDRTNSTRNHTSGHPTLAQHLAER